LDVLVQLRIAALLSMLLTVRLLLTL